ncbi:MAG TPA: twin-arginine translocase TatA/TatE family subunit [Stellaceae bacterium]|jgi:sec-independent protein translocase protein TatA|nr:twin-arginine translocase TatA/TatE family subunit [Stellaceae bacterium]
MGSMSIWHWLVVLAVGLLLFGGRGKLTNVMGDFAKGIKAFKAGMKEEEEPEAASTVPPAQVSSPPPAPAHAAAEPKREHV